MEIRPYTTLILLLNTLSMKYYFNFMVQVYCKLGRSTALE